MSPIESISIPEASEAGPPLNCEERIRLAQLETLIQGSLEKFLLAGRALLEIKTRRLYRQEYSTFQDYCMKRWAISERRGLDLVRSTAVAENLLAGPACPSGDAPLPPDLSAFQMQEGEAMVYRCDKLGHPVIVRVFCLKSEFHKVMTRRGENRNSSEFQPAICRNPANLSIALRYKTKRNISSTGCIGNSAISQCDQIVIEIRRSRRQLGLLDRKSGPVEPRHLLECQVYDAREFLCVWNLRQRAVGIVRWLGSACQFVFRRNAGVEQNQRCRLG
jgi:hypothetical protein